MFVSKQTSISLSKRVNLAKQFCVKHLSHSLFLLNILYFLTVHQILYHLVSYIFKVIPQIQKNILNYNRTFIIKFAICYIIFFVLSMFSSLNIAENSFLYLLQRPEDLKDLSDAKILLH